MEKFTNMVPDNANQWKVLCSKEGCFASENGIISVHKIGWLIRCECCGSVYDMGYFVKQLKKAGINYYE